MNIKRLLLILMVMGFAVGCSSTPEEDEGEMAAAPAVVEEEPMKGALDPVEVVEVVEAVEEDMGVTSYMVERGDNLWSISGNEDIYGDPYQWPLIYKANREQIKDADLIHPGQDLSIVRGMSAYEIDAAVNHAKTRGAWTLGEVEASDEAYLNE